MAKSNIILGVVGLPVLIGGVLLSVPQTKPSVPATPKAPVSDPASFVKDVRPVFAQYCVSCHSGEKPAARLNLKTLSADFGDPRVTSLWKEILNVVNSNQMPPKGSPKPAVAISGRFVDAISTELANVELAKRSGEVVLRRLNKKEYDNTIRDLVGIDLNHSRAFPEDPPAGGFDNIGKALTLSPLQIELYYDAARDILNHALAEGPKPTPIKWRFEPEENKGGMDAYRVPRGASTSIILNDGENPTENGFTVMHHESWNKHVDFRNFNVPVEGEYIIRFRAAGRVPSRAQLVAGATRILAAERTRQMRENPNGKQWHEEAYQNGIKHFSSHSAYQYGPPRLNIIQQLGSSPETIAEMDIDAPLSNPGIYEVKRQFTTESAGLTFQYAYSIPSMPENHFIQKNDLFPRPELLIDWIELEGPIHPVWPPKSTQLILIDSPNKGKNEFAYARDVLTHFMTRAYRRPVTAAEVNSKLALYQAERPTTSFIEAIKMPLAAVLTSPNFLFLAEPAAASDPKALNSYQLASRLSYFLWSSMPDAELFAAAKSGELNASEGLVKHAERMLNSPKSRQFIENFSGQWLGIRKVGTNPPAENLYPEYDRHLELSIVAESYGFFNEIVRTDQDIRKLVKSEFVTINERLARYYGIPGVKGDAIRRVEVPQGVQRGGVMTQASILSTTSNGTRTSPVTRGVWVLRTLMGNDPGLPVANVGEIANKIPGIDKATVRQRLKLHRENPSCARCHDRIDPIGFSLENYNAAGEWRNREGHGYQGRIEPNDPIIDASATMPDGTPINGVAGLQSQILKNEEAFFTHFATQVATYAVGRELGFADKPQIKTLVGKIRQEKPTVRNLIHQLVVSPLFRTK